MDIIITEGFKKENKPKIEVFRAEKHQNPLFLGDSSLIAFVTDTQQKLPVPTFGLEEIKKLAGFIEKKYLTASWKSSFLILNRWHLWTEKI